MRNVLSFSTGDNKGCVIDSGDYILRLSYKGHEEYPSKAFNLYSKYALYNSGVVQTEFIQEENSLKHKKLLITYPHEWPPSLFKAAVLFHLQLLLQLDRYGLTLKDALPENILFTGTTPTFVDFYSLLPVDELAKEEWLSNSCPAGVDLRLCVLERMFVPHMLIPLLFYAKGNYTEGRRLLEECFCNNRHGESVDWSSLDAGLFFDLKLWLRALRRPETGILRGQIHSIRQLCKAEYGVPWVQRIQELIRYIEVLDVMPPASGYVGYYAAKGEDAGLGDPEAWNEKQRSVADILAAHEPQSVLDIGANTGWFSLLAAGKGAKVIALDLDLSCIDSLYRTARGAFPSGLIPLWMSFDDLGKEAFSLDAKGNVQENPFHMAATTRLRSDVVLCLGLLHHLTLGMGKSFSTVFEILSLLTGDILVLEFVDLKDKLVREEPDFFPNISRWTPETYCMAEVKRIAMQYFDSCSELPSTPAESRNLLICKKKINVA